MSRTLHSISNDLLRRRVSGKQETKETRLYLTNHDLYRVSSLLSPFYSNESIPLDTDSLESRSYIDVQEIRDVLSMMEDLRQRNGGYAALMMESLDAISLQTIQGHFYSHYGRNTILVHTNHMIVFCAEHLDRLTESVLPWIVGTNQWITMTIQQISVYSNKELVFQRDALEINDYYLMSQSTKFSVEALVLGDVLHRVGLQDRNLAEQLMENLKCRFLNTMGIAWLTRSTDYDSPYLPFDAKGMCDAILNVSKQGVFEDWTALPVSTCNALYGYRSSNRTGFFTEVHRDYFADPKAVPEIGMRGVPDIIIQGKPGAEWNALCDELKRVFGDSMTLSTEPHFHEIRIPESEMEIPLCLATAPGIVLLPISYDLDHLGIATFKSGWHGFDLCRYVKEVFERDVFSMTDAALHLLRFKYLARHHEEIPDDMMESVIVRDVVNKMTQTAYFRFHMDIHGYLKIIDLPYLLDILYEVARSNPSMKLETMSLKALKKIIPSNH